MSDTLDIDHWDPVVERRIDSVFEESRKGDEWVFCPTCTAHQKLDEVVANDGYCYGCSEMSKTQEGRRGAL